MTTRVEKRTGARSRAHTGMRTITRETAEERVFRQSARGLLLDETAPAAFRLAVFIEMAWALVPQVLRSPSLRRGAGARGGSRRSPGRRR
jgi:hypothetical protein